MNGRQFIYFMQGLSKTYPGGKQVLNNIHLSFYPDAKIGVLGVNGSGKSTLLKIMAGLDKEYNGEAWVAWLSEASGKRHEPGYALAACAGGTPAAVAEAVAVAAPEPAADVPTPPAAAPASAANTWGGCLADMWKQKPFADMVNPFTGKAPVLIEKCDPADYTLHGNISIDKSIANPIGSAVAATVSPLVASDAIDAKLQLTLAVCDKGGYPIKVSDFEF